jgi:cytochrome d ubiquinol oxidase subunit I
MRGWCSGNRRPRKETHIDTPGRRAVDLCSATCERYYECILHDADALLLARIQFGFTVSFHFIFPSFSIGLASFLAVLEALWLKTGKALYLDLFKYWLKIFAVVFAMGVVSGIVMSYQFGTNWAVFSDKAGR